MWRRLPIPTCEQAKKKQNRKQLKIIFCLHDDEDSERNKMRQKGE